MAAAPAPAHPRAGASGGSHAAAVAPLCFPRSVLVCISPCPCPPCTSTGRSPVPARVPRGFRREDETLSPLMPSREAARTSPSPLCTSTRGRGAPPPRRAAPRRRRGKGSCSVGSYAAPQGSRVASAPGGTASDPRFQPAPGTPAGKVPGRPTCLGCGSPTAAPAPVVLGGHDQLPTHSPAPPAGPCARCRRLCPLRGTFPGTGSSEPRPRQFTSRPATSLN